MKLLACLAVTVLAMSVSANATIHNVNVLLDGLQEVPPVATPATGTATVVFNDVTGEMSVTGTFQDMIGTSTNAHVHGYAGPGVAVGVVFGLTFDAGVTSGNFSGNGVIPGGNINDVLNGLTYINVHSSFKAGGEIRGQIIIPEPASIGLLGLAGLPLLSRRRRA